MNTISIPEVSRLLSERIEEVVSRLLPNAVKSGHEMLVGNVCGEPGDSLKIILIGKYAGRWKDWATDESGDLLDLWAAVHGVSLVEAMQEALDYLGLRGNSPPLRPVPKPKKAFHDVWEWRYPEKDGIAGKVVRQESEDGDKQVIPHFRRDGKAGFEKGFTPPLYGQAQHYVFWVEGEKCVCAVRQMGLPAITSQGGSGRAGKADISGLEAVKQVCFLPDNDLPGVKYAQSIAARLQAQYPEIQLKVVDLDGLRKGDDIVDWVQARIPGWDGYSPDEGIAGLKDEFFKLMKDAVPMAEAVQATEWPEPEALPGRYEVETFDFDLLPIKLRSYVKAGAYTMQCQPDHIAVPVMVALGSLVGRKLGIRPKARDMWQVTPNMSGGNVGLSSAMKTPAMNYALRHLETIAEKAVADFAEQQQEILSERKRLETEIKALQLELDVCYGVKPPRNGVEKNGDPKEVSDDLARCEGNLEKLNTRHAVRYITDDPTVEKLAELLGQNPDGLMLKRDELIGWFRSLDKKGREVDRAFYLESFDGNQLFTQDRIKRGTITCRICLSIFGNIPPGPLRRYITDALSDGGGADGLLQRFQMMVWLDPVSPDDWEYTDLQPKETTHAEAASVFNALAELDVTGLEASCPENGIPYLRFTDEAQAVFKDWFTNLHTVKVPGAEHEALRSHLIKYASLMPSLALILHLADDGKGPVSVEATVRAADWCEYLETHARRIYLSDTRPDVLAAHRLIERIDAGEITHEMPRREVIRKRWSGLNTHQKVDAGLAVLEEYGWLKVVTITHPHGGRPSQQIILHPDTRNMNPHSDGTEG